MLFNIDYVLWLKCIYQAKVEQNMSQAAQSNEFDVLKQLCYFSRICCPEWRMNLYEKRLKYGAKIVFE